MLMENHMLEVLHHQHARSGVNLHACIASRKSGLLFH